MTPVLSPPLLSPPRLGRPLQSSYLRVFQLSFSMWFSGPSLSKEAMKSAERWGAPQTHVRMRSAPPLSPLSPLQPSWQGCSWAKKGLLDQGAVASAGAHPQISAV